MSIKGNALFNVVGAIVPMFVSVVSVPLYLHAIGGARYGIMAIVWLSLDYFAFFDLGIGKATANQMARLEHGAAPDREAVFWTGALINGLMGLMGGIVLFFSLHLLFDHVFGPSLSDDLRGEVRAALPWLIPALPMAMLAAVCVATLEARQRFLALNSLQVLGTLMFQVCPLLVAVWIGPSLQNLVAAAVCGRIAAGIPLFFACRAAVPLRGRPNLRRALIGNLFRYGGWVAVTAVISPILVSIDRVLIGSFLGPVAVTRYSVPYNLVTKFLVLPGSLNRALFPRFSFLDWSEASRMAERAALSVAALTLPIILAASLVLKPVLTLWVGAELAGHAAPVGMIFLAGVWINGLATTPLVLLQGQGRPDICAKFHAAEVVPYLCVLVLGLHVAGLTGAAWAWVFRVALDAGLLYAAARTSRQVFTALGVGLALIVVLPMLVPLCEGSPARTAGLSVLMIGVAVAYMRLVAPRNLRDLARRAGSRLPLRAKAPQS